MNIIEITDKIAKNLGIESKELLDIIEGNLSEDEKNIKIPDDKMEIINNLLNSDTNIQKFETNIKSEKVKTNYNTLKNNLAKLQVLVLIKKLKKSEKCDDVLNSFIMVLNNKMDAVNNTMVSNLTLKGGGNNNNYYTKYIEYKVKYLTLKTHNLFI